MLGHEDRMSPKRRLLAVMGWLRSCEPLRDEGVCVLHHGREPLLAQVLRIARAQPLRRTEARLRQCREEIVQLAHRVIVVASRRYTGSTMTDADVEAIERATVAAVAPRDVEELPGWLLAFDSVTVNRARSAVPLSHEAPDASAVPRIDERYRARGIPPNFRIAQIASMAAAERELQRLGLGSKQPTQVMVARANDVARAASEGNVTITTAPDAAWAAVFLGEGFDPTDGASRVATLKRAPGSLFAAIREGNEVIAGGVLALGHGWASIHGMRTALARRGEGLATRVLAALAREARRRDHERIVLQVEVANETAARVYRRCGFERAWTYAYWRDK